MKTNYKAQKTSQVIVLQNLSSRYQYVLSALKFFLKKSTTPSTNIFHFPQKLAQKNFRSSSSESTILNKEPSEKDT